MERTPLHEQHRLAGAKLVNFAGWEMPIQYSGVIDEYQTVRTKAGLFDVSHMGRLFITGEGSSLFLQRITTNDISKLAIGQAQYSMVCNDQGGILDDIFVYRAGEQEFLLCVNASNRQKIMNWLRRQHQSGDRCGIEDRTAALAQIAIQGPLSRDIMAALSGEQVRNLNLHHFYQASVAGIPCFIARTGYTGELGYEINALAAQAADLWQRLLQIGLAQGMKPAGLGARDLLRLEMGYLLYGNDINEETTPLEAGADWTVSFHKGEFVGSKALLTQRQAGLSRRLVGFELLEKAVPRHGFKVLSSQAEPIGEVTSGNLSPLLQKGLGLAYVSSRYAEPGTAILIDIRGKSVSGKVVKPPFYKKQKNA